GHLAVRFMTLDHRGFGKPAQSLKLPGARVPETKRPFFLELSDLARANCEQMPDHESTPEVHSMFSITPNVSPGPTKQPAFPAGLGDDRSGEAAALIARMGKEDASALAELHGMWSPVLLGIACRMLGDRREAEEAVQDTFIRMWHRS